MLDPLQIAFNQILLISNEGYCFLDLRSILFNLIALARNRETLKLELGLGHDLGFLCYSYTHIFIKFINKSRN